MALRIDVNEDGKIDVMRPHLRAERNVFHRGLDVDTAMILIRYWIQKDIELSNKNRFVSQAKRDARRAFRDLEKRANAEHKSRI